MGGSLVSADDTGRGTIPLNLRLDGGPPMAASAPADSVAHMLIERHLPAFMQDALRAAALLGQRRQADKELARDPLTGVANRRRLTASLAAMRPGEALVILDLDHFKEVNDTFGHPAGDELLKTFARFLQATVGDLGTVGRYGGEEFLILLRAPADPDGVCSMLREAWRSRGAWRAGERPPVTFSAGWAGVDERSNSRAALQAADAALYRAKARGRDQACGPVEEFAA
jgi:diguanylate cyclase (GGDEF)-like protein